MVANGAPWRISDGFVQSMFGSHNQAHMIRSQLALSNDAAQSWSLSTQSTANHARDLSTRPSYWTNHRKLIFGHVPIRGKNNGPLSRWKTPFFASKEASDKPQKATLAWGIGTIKRITGWALASNRTRLASNKSSMHALGIADWRSPTLAQISGRVWTAAYWREPQIWRKHCRFCSSMFQNLDGFDLFYIPSLAHFNTAVLHLTVSDSTEINSPIMKHQKNTYPGVSQWLSYNNKRPHPLYAIIDMYA